MTIADTLIMELEREAKTTRRVLERVPDESSPGNRTSSP